VLARGLRQGVRAMPDPKPLQLFDDVYVDSTNLLTRQRDTFSSYLDSFVDGAEVQ
jgi:pyruvate dehydrogenase E1 component alpha subunit